MSDNITHILPNWFIWIITIGGVFFLKLNVYHYVKLLPFLIFNFVFLWTYVKGHEFISYNKTDFDNNIVRLMLTVNMLSVFLKYIWNFIYSPKYNEILNKFSHLYVSIISINSKIYRKRMDGSFILIVTFFVISTFIFKLKRLKPLNIYILINWMMSCYRHAVETELMAIILGRTKELFIHLNHRLSKVDDTTSHFLETINQSSKGEIQRMEKAYKIKLLKKISSNHYNVVDALKDLNPILSSSTCMWLLINIAEMIYASYFFISLGISNRLQIQNAVWVSLELMKLGYVIFTWNALSQEANRSVIILHDIWNKYADCDKIDSRIRYLQFISLRFMTSKLKFTAYGFFPLDWTFLHMVLAVTATYIIILIQLRY